MAKVYSRTKGILPDTVSGFCPGCMHGTVHKLIGEAAEELGKLDKLVRVEGVGCCGLGQFYVAHDATISAHGRACAVATGIKRSSPRLHIPGRWRPRFYRSGRDNVRC